ncbi:MAG: gas vesicle protein [Cyanobacteria bacterium]|nr:gas vesicle protein [Cyanobacteria bacterium GSL.Bin21]
MVNLNTNQPKSHPSKGITNSTQSSSLADILERVLDKGIVIAGDITVSVGSTELLSIRIRLLISSVDKAREMGINWWENDPYLSSQAHLLQEENQALQKRLETMETELRRLKGENDPQASFLSESESENP